MFGLKKGSQNVAAILLPITLFNADFQNYFLVRLSSKYVMDELVGSH